MTINNIQNSNCRILVKLIMIFIIFGLLSTASSAEVTYETSATGRLVGDSPTELTKLLMSNGNIQLKSAGYYSSDLLMEAHQQPFNFYDEGDLATYKLDQLKQLFTDQLQSAFPSWGNVESGMPVWKTSELLILEPLLDSFSYEYSNPASGINDLLWKNNFRKYKPVVIFDSDFAGLYLPKSADKGKSFVGSLGQDSTIIAPTAVPNRELVLALVCNLQLTDQQEQTLGRLLINTRNNYYRNSSGPSGLPLLSYVLYGLPNRTYSTPDQTMPIDECYRYRKDTANTTEISNKFTNQALFTNQSQSTADLNANSSFPELSATITSTIADADYNIVSDGNYSFLKIKGFSIHRDILDLVSPRKLETIEFPLKTIITNYELVSLEDPVELTISDLPMYGLDGLTEKICHDSNSSAGVNFSPSFTEDSLLILAETNPVEVIDCASGKLRLYKKIKYKIDYIPSSDVLIESVQYPSEALPDAIVDVNVLMKNITLNAVSGTLRIVDVDANSILAEQEISGNANAVRMQFTAPNSEGMHLYRAEFLQNGEVKTTKEFWLDVKGLDAELLLPETARGATKIQLLISNPFNYMIPISIKHSLLANDEIIESGELSITAPQGESIAEWEYFRIYKEQQYYEVRAELEYEGKTKTIIGVLVSNNPPELAPLQDISINEGEFVKIDVKAFDLDNDSIIFTISDPIGNDGFWQTDRNDVGIYTITATASDGLLADSQQFTVAVMPIDKEPPSIGIYSPEQRDYSYTRELDVAFDAVDALSELAYVKANLDGSEIASNTTLELNEFELGKHTLVVEAADANGNSASRIVDFNIIDDVAPVSFASISGNQKSPGIYAGKVIVELTASDGKSGIDYIEYSFDGENFIKYENPFEISGEDFNITDITIFYKATDKSGNREAVKETKKITQNANSSIAYGNPSWFAGQDKIVFDASINGNYAIYSMNLDGTDLQQLTSGQSNNFEPAVNSDGSKIVFTSDRAGNSDLWLMGIDGNNQMQLTTNSGSDSMPSWDAEGRQIAFVSNRDGKNGIWITDVSNNREFLLQPSLGFREAFEGYAEGASNMAVGTGTYEKTLGNWLGSDAYVVSDGINGKSLAFGIFGGSTAKLYFPVQGEELEFKIKPMERIRMGIATDVMAIDFWARAGTITAGLDESPLVEAYSPGTAYKIKIRVAGSMAEVYVNDGLKARKDLTGSADKMSFIQFNFSSKDTPAGTPFIVLVDDILLGYSAEFGNPEFNPEASEIAFAYNFYGNNDIWIINPSESTSKQLTKSKSSDMHATWNPLGDAIAFTSEESGSRDIWLVDSEGKNPIRLTSDASAEELPAWNPNDNRILFISGKDGYSNIYLMELGKPLTIKIDNTIAEQLQTTDNAPLDWRNKDVIVNLNVDANSGPYTTYYRINDENILHTGNQIVLGESGYYVVFYYSQDTTVTEELKSTPLIRIDKESPELLLISPIDANYLYSDNLQINFSATDEISGINAVEAILDGNSVENMQTIDLQNMVGQHIFTLIAADKAGNKAAKTISFNVIADIIPPITTDNAPSGWQNTDVIVALAATDNLSGVAKTNYSINGGTLQEGNEIALAETGEYAIDYYSTDNAGNVEDVKHSAKVQIDKILPIVTITSPEAKDYSYTSSFTIQYSATDEISGIANTSAEIDGIAVENSQTIDLFNYSIGKHAIAANARDLAGNEASTNIEFSVIDDVPPTTTDNTDKEWHNSNITITLTATDEKLNVASIHYIVNSGAEQIASCNAQTCIANVLIDYEHNNNTIEYWVVDEYGNAGEHKLIDGIKLDKTAPIASADNADSEWHIQNISIAIDSQDLQIQGIPSGVEDAYYIIYNDEIPKAMKRLSIDGMPIIDYEDNDNRIEYWSADIAGNEGLHTIKKEIKLDKTAPQIELSIAPQDKYYTTEPLPVVYSALDPQVQGTSSNNLNLQWSIDGIAVENPNVNPIACSHTLALTATDLAGNSSSKSIEYEAILKLVGEAQLKITPETLNVNPGTLTAHAEFPLPYSATAITSAYADYAAMEQLAGDNMKFRRQDIERALAERGLELDAPFEVWGTFTYNGQSCKFEGSDDIAAVEPDGENGKGH